jgi:hypothetical protein
VRQLEFAAIRGIVTVALIISADSDDARSLFTAIPSDVVVFRNRIGGLLAETTVYAVPQVLAAGVPISSAGAQLGTM